MLACLILIAQVSAAPSAAPPSPSWVWVRGEGPPHYAPACTRFFRRTFSLPARPASASLLITADDTYEAFLNGKLVGKGDSWEWVSHFDVGPLLRAGRNVLAVRVTNTAAGPSAVILRLEWPGGAIVSDGSFRASRTEPPAGWEQPGFDDSAWQPALVLGPAGMAPWGEAVSAQFEARDVISDIVHTYRADDPVLVVPTPKGRLAATRTVRLSSAAAPVRVTLKGVPPGAYAVELLDRALKAEGLAVARQTQGAGGSARAARISLTLDPSSGLARQAYRLRITPQAGAAAVASAPAGLTYAVDTLVQASRVVGGALMAPEADLDDAPACELRGPVMAPASADWLDFAAFFKLNSWMISSSGPEQLAKEADRRGIELIPVRHLPDDFDFQSEAQLQDLVKWALAAAAAGYRIVSVDADDHPSEVHAAADKKRFGPGMAGLGKAHAYLINELKRRLAGRIELVFCPRVYYEVDKAAYDPGTVDQRAYLANLSKGLDAPLTCWITQVTPEFLHESAKRFGALPLAWHNFFPGDTTDWKVYYEAYPVVRDPSSARGFYVLGNVREPDLWRPNYVTFAGNTWNPRQPIGLREAFTSLFGVKAGRALTKYAVLAGGHDRPIGVMADFWQEPEDVAARFLGSGWAGVVAKAKPTRALLDHCLALYRSAGQAAEMPLADDGVPAATASRLKEEAQRTHLAFGLWAHRVADKLGVPCSAGDPSALRKGLRALLLRMGLNSSVPDWALTEKPAATKH